MFLCCQGGHIDFMSGIIQHELTFCLLSSLTWHRTEPGLPGTYPDNIFWHRQNPFPDRHTSVGTLYNKKKFFSRLTLKDI